MELALRSDSKLEAIELSEIAPPAEATPTKPIEWAKNYSRRGWCTIPIPLRSKNPGRRGWQELRIDEVDLATHFNGEPQNIGVLLGEPSGGLIDADLDHPLAIELAPQYLPSTPAVFGRQSKRRSHYLYRVTGLVNSVRHKSTCAGTIVELRSTGSQTVFPGSVHESGEPIEWEAGAAEAEPAEIDAQTLTDAVKRLADAVRVKLGEKPKQRTEAGKKIGAEKRTKHAAARCLAAMRRMDIVDHKDGSSRLFAAACRAVEHDLDDTTAISVIREYAIERPFPGDWTDDEILQRVRDAEEQAERGRALRGAGRLRDSATVSDERSTIVVTANEYEVNEQVLKALQQDASVFQRGGQLVQVVDQPQGPPQIYALPLAGLREQMSRRCRFVKPGEGEDGEPAEVHPFDWCVKGIDARRSYPGFRPLVAVVESPILRPDGTILDTPGYDLQTGLFYRPSEQPSTLPTTPSREDALAACELLLGLVCDFPFQNPAHRATWIAALLTVVGRHAFKGPAPLFLFDANMAGSGKTLLAVLIWLIATGREIARTPNPRKETEWSKLLLALALSGESLVLIDNIMGSLGSASLNAALTATVWQDRLLGKSKFVSAPLVLTWLASGNNVVLDTETCRRVVHCRLESREENPESRAGFKYPDLKNYVAENRGQLLGAALTILRAYFFAGRPQSDIAAWGSFEGWSNLIRQCVVWLGLPDPGDTRETLRTHADRDGALLAQLLHGLQEADSAGRGMTTADILKAIGSHETLANAVHELCETSPSKPPISRVLGNRLSYLRGRTMGGQALEMTPGSHGYSKWRVVSTISAASSAAGADKDWVAV